MKATVTWLDNVSFAGETGSGHTIIMDGSPEFGGQDKGARPMEMLLLGLGGCTSFDVMLILKKAKQDVTDCVAEITAQRAESDPKVFTKIHVHFKVSGRNIKENRVQRAIELSATKYCSASIMLSQAAEITHDYEIIAV